MSERFVIGRMDPCSSTIFLTKAEPSFAEDEEEPLDIGSWLTLYQGDGPPRTAILCFEPKTKRAKDIKEGDVILSDGNPYRVLNAPGLPDADGEISIHAYDIFADEVTDCITDDTEENTIVATWQTRYSVVRFSLPAWTAVEGCWSDAKELAPQRIVPPAEVISGTLVLQKQEGRIGDNPERVFKLPGGRLGPSLLYFFNAAKLCRMPISRFCKVAERMPCS